MAYINGKEILFSASIGSDGTYTQGYTDGVADITAEVEKALDEIIAMQEALLPDSPTPTKLTFNIASVDAPDNVFTYTFESGMTWSTWIASEYNTAGFYISGASVYHPSAKQVYYDNTAVNSGDLIESGDYFWESAVTTSTFTIGEYGSGAALTKYTFEDGMTWAAWVANTKYNTDGFYLESNRVCTADGAVVFYGSNSVSASSAIVANRQYSWVDITPTTATFTIGEEGSGETTTYTFESGMTWAEWVVSGYNTDGYKRTDDDTYIYTADGKQIYYNGTAVETDDTIVENGVYVWKAETVVTKTFVIKEVTDTIDTAEAKTYTFEEGMTWAAWIASEYNTDKYVITNGYIYTANGERVLNSVAPVTGSTVIDETEDATYWYKKVVIATFTIGVSGGTTTTYSFEDGMNWTEWVADTEYNTASFKVEDELVYDADGKQVYYDGTAVASTEDIVADRAYTLITVVTTFQFTIGKSDTTDHDYTLTFEEDMTWATWIASDYNTVGFTISGTTVYHPDGDTVYYGYTAVKTTDAIKAGERYVWRMVSTFTLYVNGLEWYGDYTFEVGMTWSEFIDSGFNTSLASGFIYEDGNVYAPNGTQVYDGVTPVKPDNTISSDSYYGRATKSFTVTLSSDGTTKTYQFEEDMTWAYWIGSEYDTDGDFWVDDDAYVKWGTEADNIYVWADGGTIPATDAIIAGKAYECRAGTKSFTVKSFMDGTTTWTYNFDDGMTWETWCASSYNTNGYWIDDNGLVRADTAEVTSYIYVDYGVGAMPEKDDTIVAGQTYEYYSFG